MESQLIILDNENSFLLDSIMIMLEMYGRVLEVAFDALIRRNGEIYKINFYYIK